MRRVAAAAFLWMPRSLPGAARRPQAPPPGAAAARRGHLAGEAQAQLTATTFAARAAHHRARGARRSIWGGRRTSRRQVRAPPRPRAPQATRAVRTRPQIAEAGQLLDTVEQAAPAALAAELAAGERAVAGRRVARFALRPTISPCASRRRMSARLPGRRARAAGPTAAAPAGEHRRRGGGRQELLTGAAASARTATRKRPARALRRSAPAAWARRAPRSSAPAPCTRMARKPRRAQARGCGRALPRLRHAADARRGPGGGRTLG